MVFCWRIRGMAWMLGLYPQVTVGAEAYHETCIDPLTDQQADEQPTEG
jgi:hypothetical protein